MEIEKGTRIGVAGGSKAVRPSLKLSDPLSDEETRKYAAIVGAGPWQRAPRPAGAVTALIVDDDPQVRSLHARVLKEWDLEVSECGSGDDALKALSQKTIDLVLLDLKLPGIDGFEVTRGLRSYLKISDAYIFVLSGVDDPKGETAVLNLGADAFLKKPYTIDQLSAHLGALARRLLERV